MARLTVEDSSLVQIADKIRSKSRGTEPLVFPEGFVEGLDNIEDPNTKLGDLISGRTTDLVIPASTGSIATYFFYQNRQIDNVIIEDGVTEIGAYAFSHSDIRSIDIPNSITTIKDYAFNRCKGLSSVNLPDSITSIESNVFSNCESLKSIDIPNSVTKIGNDAFYGCKWLSSIDLSTIEVVMDDAFNGCSSLESLDLPNATYLGEWAFRKCSSLKSVNVPNVIEIGASPFNDNASLTSLSLPKLTTVSSLIAYGCNALTTVTMDSITEMREGFTNCTALETLILGSSTLCTLSKSNAFDGCTKFNDGTASIYVPRALIEDYKVATNWSNYASLFKAIEDYPEITGGTTE